jgi:hypothetical protein
MLKKLLKYEWKSSWRIILAMNCFLLLVTLLGMFSFRALFAENQLEVVQIFGVLSLILYYLTIIVIIFAVLIFMGVRFYRNLYGDEGYLMHTLPVSVHAKVLSKLFVTVAFYLLTTIAIILSVISLGFSLITYAEPTVDLAAEIAKVWREVQPILVQELGMDLGLYGFLIIIGVIVGTFSAILMIYAAISIGQMFGRHKVMGSIVSYIGLYILQQTVTSVITLPFTIDNTISNIEDAASFGALMNSTLTSSFVIAAVFGIFYYILTVVLMKNKMNLD